VVFLDLRYQLVLSQYIPILFFIQHQDFIVTKLQLRNLLFQYRLLFVHRLDLVALTVVLQLYFLHCPPQTKVLCVLVIMCFMCALVAINPDLPLLLLLHELQIRLVKFIILLLLLHLKLLLLRSLLNLQRVYLALRVCKSLNLVSELVLVILHHAVPLGVVLLQYRPLELQIGYSLLHQILLLYNHIIQCIHFYVLLSQSLYRCCLLRRQLRQISALQQTLLVLLC